MQDSLPTQPCIFGDYQVEITQINLRARSISAIDCKNFKEYSSEALQLKQIGVNTLVKALQRSRSEIQIQISHRAEALRICVKVTSLFLLSIEEEIMIGNERQANPTQIVKRKMNQLNGASQVALVFRVFSREDTGIVGRIYDDRLSQSYPRQLSVHIKFFRLGYWSMGPLYLYEGELFITNSGFYLPQANSDCFVPILLRKRIKVLSEKQLCITTCSYGGYSRTFKNAIVVARRIQES